MKNVFTMPDQNQSHTQASMWVSRIDAGLSQQEEQEFSAWLASDEQNLAAFKYLAHLWDDMDDLGRLAEMFPDEPYREQKSLKTGFAIAASFITAFLALGFIVVQDPFVRNDIAQRYETSIGEHSIVTLPDGSQLTLNTNSLVTVVYAEQHRLLTLERGEIHVDVKHDETKPLSVKAGDRVVQAVGTAFNIQLLNDKELELIVTDGKVRVGNRQWFEKKLAKKNAKRRASSSTVPSENPVRLANDTLAITQGERLILGEQSELLQSDEPIKLEQLLDHEVDAVLSWHEGNIVFNGETLEVAMSEVSRYTSSAFEFGNEELKDIRIAGLFKSGDVNGLLSALEDSFEIQHDKIGNKRYRLYR